MLLSRACFLTQCLSEQHDTAIKLSLWKTYKNNFYHIVLNYPHERNVADFLMFCFQILLSGVFVLFFFKNGNTGFRTLLVFFFSIDFVFSSLPDIIFLPYNPYLFKLFTPRLSIHAQPLRSLISTVNYCDFLD